MDTIIVFTYIGIGALLTLAIVSILLLVKANRNIQNNNAGEKFESKLANTKQDILWAFSQLKQENQTLISSSFKNLSEVLINSQKESAAIQDKRLYELNTQITQRNDTLQKTISQTMESIEKKLDVINKTVEDKLSLIQKDNNKQLEQMRETVNEKLQKTLEERIGQSFKQVNETLEQVFKSLGEMQNLAVGVGDLKKVLSNVKTRGILGEIQLGAILEQILSPEQYETNCATKPEGRERVEYAIKMPGTSDEGTVYLPIDSKFPSDAYSALVDAYEMGVKTDIDQAGSLLEKVITKSAKDIHEKYIGPPHTTDFGVLFLPFEGLYAEVVRRGLIERLQNDYKIMIAGPTTMGALLNSLQMGFKTLAIQKRSSEVWNILGAVKTEFEKFGSVLTSAQNRLRQADNEIEALVGTRTRQIQRKLKTVSLLPDTIHSGVLETEIIGDTDWVE